MRADLFTRIVFVLYCIEAGVFLVWAPWTGFWERTFTSLLWHRAGFLMLEPLMRGAVTGFGLVHLVWGFNDFESLLRRVVHRERVAP